MASSFARKEKKKPPGNINEVIAINKLVYGGDARYMPDSRALYEMWRYYADKPDGKMRFFYDVCDQLEHWEQWNILAKLKEPRSGTDTGAKWKALLGT